MFRSYGSENQLLPLYADDDRASLSSFVPSLQEPLLRRSRAASDYSMENELDSCCESRLHPGPLPLVLEEISEAKPTTVAQLPAVGVTVVMMMVNAVTYGSLVFNAPAFKGFQQLPDGIIVWLLATFASMLGMLTASGLRNGVGSAAVEAIPILHAVFAKVSAAMPDASNDEVLGTCLALTFLATFLQGILFWQAGRLGASRLLRAVPLVVLKGALCGVALFLLNSSVNTATGGVTHLRRLEAWPHWMLSITLGCFYFMLDERFRSPTAMAAVFMGVAALPAILVFLGLFDASELREAGWLFCPAAADGEVIWFRRLAGIYSRTLPLANWNVVVSQFPAMVGLWFSFALLSITDLKAIELLTQREIVPPTAYHLMRPLSWVIGSLQSAEEAEMMGSQHKKVLNKELRTLGLVNLLSALMGAGWPSYILSSLNITAYKLGARTRVYGSLVLVGVVGGLFVAAYVIPFLPRALPASVSWWLGMVFVKETAVDIALQHSHKLDIFIVVCMASTMVLSGFLNGLLLGFLLSMGAFTLIYSSQQAAVSAHSDARYFRSNVGRAPAEQGLLERFGHRIAVVHVNGYLMFGSSPQVLDSVTPLLTPGGPSWVVLSYRHVRGLDYSAVLDLITLGRKAKAQNVSLVLTELRGNVPELVLKACHHVHPAAGNPIMYSGLCYVSYYQAALRMCEEALLAQLPRPKTTPDPVGSLLARAFGDYLDEGQEQKLRNLFEEVTYEPGSTIWRAGEPATFVLGIVEGELLVFQDQYEGGQPWLQELSGPGAFLGFGALCSYLTHSTTAVVPQSQGRNALFLRLRHGDFLRLCEEDPQLANSVLRGFLRRISYEMRDLSRLAAHA